MVAAAMRSGCWLRPGDRSEWSARLPIGSLCRRTSVRPAGLACGLTMSATGTSLQTSSSQRTRSPLSAAGLRRNGDNFAANYFFTGGAFAASSLAVIGVPLRSPVIVPCKRPFTIDAVNLRITPLGCVSSNVAVPDLITPFETSI